MPAFGTPRGTSASPSGTKMARAYFWGGPLDGIVRELKDRPSTYEIESASLEWDDREETPVDQTWRRGAYLQDLIEPSWYLWGGWDVKA
jgi:hypothetical protein